MTASPFISSCCCRQRHPHEVGAPKVLPRSLGVPCWATFWLSPRMLWQRTLAVVWARYVLKSSRREGRAPMAQVSSTLSAGHGDAVLAARQALDGIAAMCWCCMLIRL